jgi:hypothetical protein
MTEVQTLSQRPMTTPVLDTKRIHAAHDIVRRDFLSRRFLPEDLEVLEIDLDSYEVPAIRMVDVEWNWAVRVSLELRERFAEKGIKTTPAETESGDESADVLLLYPRL